MKRGAPTADEQRDAKISAITPSPVLHHLDEDSIAGHCRVLPHSNSRSLWLFFASVAPLTSRSELSRLPGSAPHRTLVSPVLRGLLTRLMSHLLQSDLAVVVFWFFCLMFGVCVLFVCFRFVCFLFPLPLCRIGASMPLSEDTELPPSQVSPQPTGPVAL